MWLINLEIFLPEYQLDTRGLDHDRNSYFFRKRKITPAEQILKKGPVEQNVKQKLNEKLSQVQW